jgi:D-glycero-alpha-D-manno-heptose-7-phosphate kinase
MRLHATAPARIDLAGGTLDLWPLFLLHPKAMTVNVAINRYAHCVLEPRSGFRIALVNRDTGQREEFASLRALQKKSRFRLPLLAELVRYFAPAKGLTLTTWSEVPAGAGLGGSSTLGVAIAAALSRWLGRNLSTRDFVSLVRDIEVKVLHVPTGEQDHYPAAYGGVSAIHLEPIATRREGLRVNRKELESRLLLAYTGKPRRSGVNNWTVFKRTMDGDRKLHNHFAKIADAACSMRKALLGGRWAKFARLLEQDWQARRRNAPAISTSYIEKLMRTARRNGAQAGKVCGAGGGGCVVFVVPPKKKAKVAEALLSAGATVLPFKVSASGVRVRRFM